MKFLIFSVCALAACASANMGVKRYENFFIDCLQEAGQTKESFTDLWKSEDPQAGCIILCTLKKCDVWGTNEIDKEKLLSAMREVGDSRVTPQVLQFTDECVDQGNRLENDCAKSYEYTKCLVEKIEAE